MFSDTMALTVAGVAKTLTRINQDGYGAEYLLRESTLEYRVKIRHGNASDPNKVTQDRHNVEITRRVFATATTPEFNDKVYYVDQILAGRSAADLAKAIFDWSTASSNANLLKLEGWES